MIFFMNGVTMFRALILQRYGLIVLCLAGMLSIAGCSFRGTKDGAPSRGASGKIEDAIPRAEPKSRYGNATSYVVQGKRYYTLKSSRGFVQQGVASWYGTKFHNKKTSSGESYDMWKMTAAHKRLPLPTYVEVTNLENKKKVIVRVNDRGPFVDNRIIDLSYAAAMKLDITESGTAVVEVRAIDVNNFEASPVEDAAPQIEKVDLSPEPIVPVQSVEKHVSPRRAIKPLAPAESPIHSQQERRVGTQFFVQVGSFQKMNNAEALESRLSSSYPDNVQIIPVRIAGIQFYRVYVGPVDSAAKADILVSRLRVLGIQETDIRTADRLSR